MHHIQNKVPDKKHNSRTMKVQQLWDYACVCLHYVCVSNFVMYLLHNLVDKFPC